MAIHLVTFASPRFRPRQLLLGWSGLANSVVDSVTHWNPIRLKAAGFENMFPKILLKERGCGFYAWKPFIIRNKLRESAAGDIIFYCDVGRIFPYKILDCSINFFLDWMVRHGQPMMPGVMIPWHGPMSMWTKRDAFVFMNMDFPKFHSATPIQASFSFWKNCSESQNLVNDWVNLSTNRQMISDDTSNLGRPEYFDFIEHRHDQSILSLICMGKGIRGIYVGNREPSFDCKCPCAVAKFLGSESVVLSRKGQVVLCISSLVSLLEWIARLFIKFNKPVMRPKLLESNFGNSMNSEGGS